VPRLYTLYLPLVRTPHLMYLLLLVPPSLNDLNHLLVNLRGLLYLRLHLHDLQLLELDLLLEYGSLLVLGSLNLLQVVLSLLDLLLQLLYLVPRCLTRFSQLDRETV